VSCSKSNVPEDTVAFR